MFKFLGISIALILVFVAPYEYQTIQYFDAINQVLTNTLDVMKGLK